MLQKIGLPEKKLESYKAVIDEPLFQEITGLRHDLHSLRVCHISSTPFGGGISEVLFSIIPLERDIGINADWYTMQADDQIIKIVKMIHNGLQGATCEISNADKQLYLQFNNNIARDFPFGDYDIVIVHSHNLLALPYFAQSAKARWIWRCHLDTSNAGEAIWSFLKSIIAEYHGAIFTLKEFVPLELNMPLVAIVPPAIDPLSLKNRDIPLDQCSDFANDLGLDTSRPILLHVSRLDPWKDPLGTIQCYFLAKEKLPDLQLVIISSLTLDDPETFSTLHLVDREASKDEDVHVYTNIDGIGDIEVNALQRICTVGILKSLREGFGLSVSEILWKQRPVLGSRVGGIPLQLSGSLDYCLVDDIDECSSKLVKLATDPAFSREMGRTGHETVRKNFLSPRLLRDELKLMLQVMG